MNAIKTKKCRKKLAIIVANYCIKYFKKFKFIEKNHYNLISLNSRL